MERIRNFFRAYFHEDWRIEASNASQVVQEFLNLELDSEELRMLEQELLDFVRERNDSALERDLFEELGCYYMPQNEGVPVRTWLLGLASTFGSAAEQRS